MVQNSMLKYMDTQLTKPISVRMGYRNVNKENHLQPFLYSQNIALPATGREHYTVFGQL